MLNANQQPIAIAPTPAWGSVSSGPRVLLVVAHPDDEYYFAAAVYRITHELQGIADLVVITNGEAGYRYSALAERIYGHTLTSEDVGRAALPKIRRKETLRAGKLLGIRRHHFLNERDFRYTLDLEDALNLGWRARRIERFLAGQLAQHKYDFVFTVLPAVDTHGHHQAATLLAVKAAHRMGVPVLGAEPGRKQEPITEFRSNPSHPLLTAHATAPVFTFDRMASFGYQNTLRYDIVVNWVIAEHKSQGAFQLDAGRHDCERFWVMSKDDAAVSRTQQLFSALNPHGRNV